MNTDEGLTDDDGNVETRISVLDPRALGLLLETVRKIGMNVGLRVAYAEVMKYARERIASSDEELARAGEDTSQAFITMGEISAWRKLAALYEDAPAHYTERADSHAAGLTRALIRIGLLRAQDAPDAQADLQRE
ncbi:hypothetical protein PPMP20_26580 [Paraburkholderia phymatum]|uniref:Uncharacterized protein n=1 Tax=Paraburkholderia phymatum (strain DSM 17167 / CIP 108236 / LMG 21445 / STM815) TaxID=391038 RepID=B2JL45_PARP8|nr:hypothetical protein [Paraburkholderia phymatum]ACC72574.1 hypothetical protein Bphy_3420 [Paraburkholderia phymatum STM815]